MVLVGLGGQYKVVISLMLVCLNQTFILYLKKEPQKRIKSNCYSSFWILMPDINTLLEVLYPRVLCTWPVHIDVNQTV